MIVTVWRLSRPAQNGFLQLHVGDIRRNKLGIVFGLRQQQYWRVESVVNKFPLEILKSLFSR